MIWMLMRGTPYPGMNWMFAVHHIFVLPLYAHPMIGPPVSASLHGCCEVELVCAIKPPHARGTIPCVCTRCCAVLVHASTTPCIAFAKAHTTLFKSEKR
jgi:hypothetical protein